MPRFRAVQRAPHQGGRGARWVVGGLLPCLGDPAVVRAGSVGYSGSSRRPCASRRYSVEKTFVRARSQVAPNSTSASARVKGHSSVTASAGGGRRARSSPRDRHELPAPRSRPHPRPSDRHRSRTREDDDAMFPSRPLRSECLRVASVLQSCLDSDVDATMSAIVARHLEKCRHCGLEASTYRAIKTAMTKGERGDVREPRGCRAPAQLRTRSRRDAALTSGLLT